MKKKIHRDEHFDHHIAKIEVALDAQLWGASPVVDAVKRLGQRLRRAANDRQSEPRVA